MTKKIFRSICLAALIVFFSSLILIMGVLYDYFSDIQLDQLKMQTSLVSQGIANEGIHYFEGMNFDHYRITWIDADGTILYDSTSNTDAMENHLERKEIRQALSDGYGESDRYSATLMERSFYFAKRLPDGSVVRLCSTHGTVFILLLGMSQPIFLVFAITIILSVILAARLSSHIVKPLNELDLDNPLETEHYEELSPLLLRIASQQSQLKLKETELLQKQEELHAVTSNMKEGIILLSPDGTILSINPAAASLLEPSQSATQGSGSPSSDGSLTDARASSRPGFPVRKSLTGKQLHAVSSIPPLLQAAQSALSGTASEESAALKNSCYQITASPVLSAGTVSGAVLLLFDITEKEKSERMRREFTANVSHELKTPLHSISGYAELLKNNMVKQDDIRPFADKIYSEAQRMAKLVEDIISLSRLDEGAGGAGFETAELFALAGAAVSSLSQEATEAGVTVSLTGEPAVLCGIPQLLFGILYNLCENAIKYNKKGGSVLVNIKDHPKQAVLTVRDTGIGIPPEHQEHIFERFYRVDKSHSKHLGGTGLGLSIVKHSAKIHAADIRLSSVPEQGTEIQILFPKNQSPDTSAT